MAVANIASRRTFNQEILPSIAENDFNVELFEPEVAIETKVAKSEIIESAEGLNDPFAGPGLANSGATAGSTLPRSAAYQQWIAEVQQLLQDRPSGKLLQGIVVELLCQPTGGFSEARVARGTGNAEFDRVLIGTVTRHQMLIRPGLVTEPRWLSLPEFSIPSL